MAGAKRRSIGVHRLWSLVVAFAAVMWIIETAQAAATIQAAGGAQALTVADWSVLAPDGPGKDLVVSRCYVCHNLSMIVTSRGDREFWSGQITAMVVNGADIPAEDVDPLVNYLSTQFGAEKPRLAVPVDINKASKEVFRLLPPIAAQAEAIVNTREARGRFTAPEDLLKIDGITQEQFKKILPFISAR